MVAVVDYGCGNLFSLCRSLEFLGQTPTVSGDPAVIAAASRIILPGVGAFGDAADKLRRAGLDSVLRERAAVGVPLLGICLGMQLLFERGFEFGEHRGLGLIPGDVVPLEGAIPAELKIPQMGWNALRFPDAEKKAANPVFAGVREGEYVYFVHSYYASGCDADTVAVCDYGIPVTAAVARGNVTGCQFHPEKSSDAGLAMLRGFCEGVFR